MAFSRKNFLLRVKEVNELYKEKQRIGLSTEYIYRTFIEPQYHISRSTLYDWLAIPYEKQLREIAEADATAIEWEKRQQTINFEEQS